MTLLNALHDTKFWKLIGSGTFWLLWIHTGVYQRKRFKTSKGIRNLGSSIYELSGFWTGNTWAFSRVWGCRQFVKINFQIPESNLWIWKRTYVQGTSLVFLFYLRLFNHPLPFHKILRYSPVSEIDRSPHHKTLIYFLNKQITLNGKTDFCCK